MQIEKLVRPNILNLKPYVSARNKYQDGIFLDANENSFGSVFHSDIKDLNRYPDPCQKEIREVLSRYLNIDFRKLFVGVGSDEIIDLIIRIFCEPGKSNVIIPGPTYGMYEVACCINDIEVRDCNLDNDFDLVMDSILKLADDNSRLIFLCTPNNPTGNLLSKERIMSLANSFKGIIFIDEAYIDFAGDKSFLPESVQFNNVIVSRTFSKAWGMAAARCGYCIADEFIINLLFKVKAPYSVNKFTSTAIIQALFNHNKKDKLVRNILSEKERLINQLNSVKNVIRIFPSDANFLLVEMKDALSAFDYLNKNGIRVRMRNDHPVLAKCLRITIGTREENDLLLQSLMDLK
jgi:histidinol-phosphate aminotransferase